MQIMGKIILSRKKGVLGRKELEHSGSMASLRKLRLCGCKLSIHSTKLDLVCEHQAALHNPSCLFGRTKSMPCTRANASSSPAGRMPTAARPNSIRTSKKMQQMGNNNIYIYSFQHCMTLLWWPCSFLYYNINYNFTSKRACHIIFFYILSSNVRKSDVRAYEWILYYTKRDRRT